MNERRQQVAFPAFGPARNGERGMTLIEVLVALGILAAVAVVFLVGMSVSSKGVMVSQEAVAVDSLAKSQMENTKAQPYNIDAITYPKITVPQDLVDQGYDVAIVAASLHNPDDGIQKITVIVTYNGEQPPAFTLVGYKVNR
jgi:prepilin-type N-terminal cleavage/methylation domain-containing protein